MNIGLGGYLYHRRGSEMGKFEKIYIQIKEKINYSSREQEARN